MSPTKEITLNGAPVKFAGETVQDLLTQFSLDSRGAAVEVNREIVSKQLYAERSLSAGDVVEVIQFVGGG